MSIFTFTTLAYVVEIEAADRDAAIAAYVAEAGCASVEHAAEVCGQSVEEFLADVIITELPA